MPNEKTKKTKLAPKKLIRGIILVIAGFCLLTFTIFKQGDKTYTPLQVGGHTLQVIVANTEASRARGLCCRNSLPQNQGMLFVYKKPGNYKFWMKDTKIALDMYWINARKKVVHIEHSVKPKSFPKTFTSPIPAKYILETNAGYAKKHRIKTGNQVRFNL